MAPLPRLLLTRPTDASEEMARELAGRAEVLVAPLMRIAAVPVTHVPEAEVLIFTSDHGVAHAPATGPLPAYVVGSRTAAAARAVGHDVRHVADTATALLDHLRNHPPKGRALYFRGADVRVDLAAELAGLGCPAEGVIVYRQEPVPLTPAARDWLDGERPVIVPLFSPLGAMQFGRALGGSAPIHVVALSPAVADALGSDRYETLTVCARPTASEMREAIMGRLDATARLEARQGRR